VGSAEAKIATLWPYLSKDREAGAKPTTGWKNSFGVRPIPWHCPRIALTACCKAISWRHWKVRATVLQVWRIKTPQKIGSRERCSAICCRSSPAAGSSVVCGSCDHRSAVEGVGRPSLGFVISADAGSAGHRSCVPAGLGVPCIHQIDRDAALLQDVLEWDRIRRSRLQGHGFHSAAFVTATMQICCGTNQEFALEIWVSIVVNAVQSAQLANRNASGPLRCRVGAFRRVPAHFADLESKGESG
jgi:hypothetical protein